MTAYVNAGDKAIVYAGNLHMGEWEKFLGALRDQGVEVIAPLAPGSLPAGPPSVLAVIKTPERCEMCGYHPAATGDTIEGHTVDQVIIDEAVSSDLGMRAVRAPMDCERSELHAPHPWYCATDGLTYYCKGIPS